MHSFPVSLHLLPNTTLIVLIIFYVHIKNLLMGMMEAMTEQYSSLVTGILGWLMKVTGGNTGKL
jgi:hypothetical protein